MERRTLALLAKVEAVGGSAKAIHSGFLQDEIARSAYAHQLAVENGRTVIVGVNKFADGEASPVIPAPEFSRLEAEQVARVKAVKANREPMAVRAALDALAAAAPQVATGGAHLMPLLIDAVRARATVGEISDRLEGAWGRYRPT